MSLGINHSSTSSDYSNLLSQLFSQSGTTDQTTAKTLTPDQLAAQAQITQTIHGLSTNPQQYLAPAQNQARNDVNDNYSGLADNLRQQFMANPGGGSSGKYGTAALQGDLARRKSLSDVDTGFAQTAAAAPLTAAGLSQQLLNMNMGTTTTGATTSNGTSTQTGSGTASGSETGVKAGASLFGLGG